MKHSALNLMAVVGATLLVASFSTAARAQVHIGIELVPPPLYYGPPPVYYSPPPPVYYGPGVVYGERGWDYGGNERGRGRGWVHDGWHGEQGRKGHDDHDDHDDHGRRDH